MGFVSQPSGGGGGALQLVAQGDFTNNVDIEDLNGDADGTYILDIEATQSYGFQTMLRINDDEINANYKDMYLIGNMNLSNGSGSQGQTGYRTNGNGGVMIPQGNFHQRIKATIHCNSGRPQLFEIHYLGETGASGNINTAEITGVWLNTANITKLTIITGAVQSGSYKLFKI